jgi:hypothetical protein
VLHKNFARTVWTASIVMALMLAQSSIGHAFEMSSLQRASQTEQTAIRVRRSITICELLRFNFDVKAKLYNTTSEPIARESYRADIQDIESLMKESACK